MSILREAKGVVCVVGGDPRFGWLPLGTMPGLPTPELTIAFDIRIESAPDGYLLIWECSHREYSGVRRLRTMPDAFDAALDRFGLEEHEWTVHEPAPEPPGSLG